VKKQEEKLTKPSEGFFIAKRQMQEALDFKLGELIQKKNQLTKESNYTGLTIVLIQIDQLESLRDYVRNGMLWDTGRGA
jgi:hypothetical protein